MSPRALLLLLTTLAANSAEGRGFMVAIPAGIRLQAAEVTTCADGDVCIEPTRVNAPHGIRVGSNSQEFVPAAPVVFQEPYLVKDANGADYQLWIHDVVGNRMSVEIIALAESIPAADPSGVSGSYKAKRVIIGAEETDARYPGLQLQPDGVYRMGATRGIWAIDGATLTLSGHFRSWGPAAVDPKRGTLTFRFQRGPLAFEIVFVRAKSGSPLQVASPSSVARASRTPGS